MFHCFLGPFNGYYQGPSFIAPHIGPRLPGPNQGRGRGNVLRLNNRRPVR